MLAPGIRVVRGPDWIWQNQDGGEGHVGTLCEIGRSGSSHSPERTVVINWDSGHRTNYRVGYQGQYDLIVVDNAQIGVKHPNIICDGCSKAGIAGIRFRCAQCNNFDICATCYGNDVHDLEHSFIRFQTANSVGVRVAPRKNSIKIPLKGIYVNSKVVRGSDWEWGQQDGGEGKTGRVLEIRGWDNESCRSVANVSWSTGSTNVYRLGHKGNVDLKFVHASIGGYYYKDHMPILGQLEEQQPIVPSTRPKFSVGDKVKVCLDKDSLMVLQQGHGGWNPRMAEFLNKVGTVHRITDKGDIRVQYEACTNRWTFHPAALIKVYSFHVGDMVTIINDALKVQQLQKGHGEWVDTMRNTLGKSGKIIKIYSDGDLRIQLDNAFALTLNPKCVKLERSPLATAAERSNSMMDLSHQRTDHVMMPLSGLSGSSAADILVREAAQGKLEYVQHYLGLHPDQVDVLSGGKTCLQVAAHQGHIALVNYLLSLRANVNVVDKEGDSTLHYAAFGNQPEIMRILLQNGANINVLNSSHCSALHISAHKKPPHCVKVLLEFHADVNVQDSYGDTALHDAIGKENSEVIELLCNASSLDLTIRNRRGFNALHHAALKGNILATKQILQLARQLVDVKKDDGFAALHLAALNGHAKVVEILVKEGLAEIDIRNNRRQTPFLLAVSQGHSAAIEKLIDLQCDILAKDEDGDNAMHLCIIKKANLVQDVPQTEAPKIFELYQLLHTQHNIQENRLMYTLLCYLASKGCRIEPNYKGNRIFDWISDKDMKDLILSYENKRTLPSVPSSAPQPSERNVRDELSENQIYSNFDAMNLAVSDISSSISNSEPEPLGQLNSSNPPTPARRTRQNGRETATPSPHHITNFDADETKKINIPHTNLRNQTISPPLTIPPTGASSSSSSGLPIATIGPQPLVNNTSSTDIPTTSNFNNLEISVDVGRASQSPNRNVIINNKNNIPMSKMQQQQLLNRKQNQHTILQMQHHHQQQQQLLMSNQAPPPQQQPQECIVCNDVTQLIIFEPCRHQISCEECGVRMKKCLSCGVIIERRLTITGTAIQPHHPHQQTLSVLPQQLGLQTPQSNVNNQQGQLFQQQQQSKDNNNQRQPSADRLRYLESKILEIEETHSCSICMERRRNVAFLCGHSACSKCADTLKICHMCRKTISKKINLY